MFSDENKTLVEQLDDLRDQLNEILETSNSVDLIVKDAQRKTSQGDVNIAEAEKILEKIQLQLRVWIR